MNVHIFPTVYGNEEETSLKHLHANAIPSGSLVRALEAYRQDPSVGIISHGVLNNGKMDSTGGGMHVDRDHLEFDTPEYRTISELKARLQAHELYAARIATSYLRKYPQFKGIGINRRVVDSVGNTFGVHDNFGVRYADEHQKLKTQVGAFMTAHFLTRSFVTGTGFVGERELLFAQKLSTLASPDDYGYASSLYRTTDEDGGTRFESRSSDLNISPWAVGVRLGSTAIALAIARTPLAQQFEWMTKKMNPSRHLWRPARDFNKMDLTRDGQLTPSNQLRRAVAFQRQLANTFLGDLTGFGDRPPELMHEAKELVGYCDDMGKVLHGEEQISLLAHRADWAAKFVIVLRRLARDSAAGMQRTLHDDLARRDDLGYDFIQVVRGPQDAITTEHAGYAYKLRDKHHYFSEEVPAADVAAAADGPPDDTRAALRARLFREYQVIGSSWRTMSLQNAKDHTDPVVIDMHSPLATTFTDATTARLEKAVRRRPQERVMSGSWYKN